MLGCQLDRRYVYFPAPWRDGDWKAVSGLPLEDVPLVTSDGVRLHAWYVDVPGSRATVLWCHGNAGNVIDRLDQLATWRRRELSVLLIDYRGYGRSGGQPSEAGLYRDAMEGYNYLIHTRRIPPKRIILYGQSLGAAVIGDVATHRPAAGLILETPFPSIRAMVRAYYGAMPMHWLLEARYDLASRLAYVRMPVLVIHGDRDSIVPLALGQQVFDAAREPKEFYLVAGADHNNVEAVGGLAYGERVMTFVRRVTPDPEPRGSGASPAP